MEENRLNILNESTSVISRLQLLSVYFEEEIVYKLYLRTQVIHNLFANNTTLDISKLQLYHLQFTSSTIELLKKIKKSNEQQVSLLLDEIQINKDLIAKLDESAYNEKTFAADAQRQTLKVNTSLRRLYEALSVDSNDPVFSKNIYDFSANYARDFYHEVPRALLDEMIVYSPNEVYRNSFAVIHRKLMGTLCKYDFRTTFFCGLKAGELVLEIYKLPDEDDYDHYLFMPARNLFLFCDLTQIKNIDWNNTLSKKGKIMQELKEKNNQLQSLVKTKKTYIPAEIIRLLEQNYEKISDVNFLENISNFDAQANILKTMLNTDFM